MKVLVLAAGYGTRLKALGENTPKALLPINGKPLINFILKTIEAVFRVLDTKEEIELARS